MASGGKQEFNNYEEVMGKVQKQGLTESTSKLLRESMDQWKKVDLQVGVIGNSGSGKSSFINAALGMDETDPKAAKVGVVETTREPTPYKLPDKPLTLWDLPGVGTASFPKETYLQKIEFRRYEFFIIISSERFSDSDFWLAKAIQQENKKFYFIRSKIDMDVHNSRRQNVLAKEVLRRVHEDCHKNLNEKGFVNVPIFLISNHHPNDWDFQKLMGQLIYDAPKKKQEALVLSIAATGEEAIRAKKKALKRRIWGASALASVGALVPVPGTSILANIAVLSKEISFYEKQFGLDQHLKLDILFQGGHLMVGELSKLATKQEMLQLLKMIFTIKGTQNLSVEAMGLIPFAGTALSVAITFATTYNTLHCLLDNFEQEALKNLNVFTDKL